MRATWLAELAWATIEADACTRICCFAKFVVSAAISTSMMRPWAASRFDILGGNILLVKLQVGLLAPICGRMVAMFQSFREGE